MVEQDEIFDEELSSHYNENSDGYDSDIDDEETCDECEFETKMRIKCSFCRCDTDCFECRQIHLLNDSLSETQSYYYISKLIRDEYERERNRGTIRKGQKEIQKKTNVGRKRTGRRDLERNAVKEIAKQDRKKKKERLNADYIY